MSYGGVDQDDGDLAVGEHLVVIVGCVGLGVQPTGEHDTGDLLLQEELDVVGLGDPALGLRTEHGGQPLLGERASDHLGEGREDRVLQLGQDQPDQPGALTAELRRALVAEHVQRGENGLPRGVGDAWLAVQHAADRGLADSYFLGNLSKSSRHKRKISAKNARRLRCCGYP